MSTTIYENQLSIENKGDTLKKVHPPIAIQRHLEVHELIKDHVLVPEILDHGEDWIITRVIENAYHSFDEKPNIEAYHNITNTFHRSLNPSIALNRLNNWVKNEEHKKVALDCFEKGYNLETDFVFLHADAHHKNYLFTDKGTVWLDYADSRMGPKGYDTVHQKINTWAAIEELPDLTQAELYLGIFAWMKQCWFFKRGRYSENLDNALNNLNLLLQEANIDLEIQETITGFQET